MMKNSRQIFILLVFVPLFGMVAPDIAWGEDSAYVRNFMQSSSHTGGYSTNGTDGADGKDGVDGRDGAPGNDGADVYSTESRATIELYNTIKDDEQTTHVYSSTTGTGEVEHSSNTSTSAASNHFDTATASEATPAQTVTPTQQSRVQSIITALQKLIEQYVNLLF